MPKLRKLMFVLPNLFTVTSIFCGFHAITLCMGEPSPAHLQQAAIAILFAMFFDGFDGRVARLTKTQSQFGMELDSLADVISFGVAPALLVYQWALGDWGMAGTFVAFAYAACGALRLARFNVIAQRSHGAGGSSDFFVGLPIPFAAFGIVVLVLAHHALTEGAELGPAAQAPVAVAVGLLSLLMVSTVRYRTFKKVRLNRISLGLGGTIAAAAAAVAFVWHPAFMLAMLFGAYLVMGLGESMVLLGRRVVAQRVGGAAAAVLEGDDADDDDDDEDEVAA